MTRLEAWLPEKEMFGVFRLRSVQAEEDRLTAVACNEVFCFTITFQTGVSAYRVTPAAENQPRLDALRAEYGVIMRGNTFFRLYDGTENDRRHYLIAATNYVVDIWAEGPAKVRLEKSRS